MDENKSNLTIIAALVASFIILVLILIFAMVYH